MGEKLISKNHLTPTLISFFSGLSSKINKDWGIILGKFQSGSRPGT
jgi:hypothetical protein